MLLLGVWLLAGIFFFCEYSCGKTELYRLVRVHGLGVNGNYSRTSNFVGAVAKELVDERRAVLSSGAVNSEGIYLTHLLSNENITLDEIYSNVMEMLFAGIDTVRCLQSPAICLHHPLFGCSEPPRCGSVAQWLGRWTCDWRSRVQSQSLHCRVQPWTSCSHTLSSASGVTFSWRYINQYKLKKIARVNGKNS